MDKKSIFPKLLLCFLLLSIMSSFINIDPTKLVEIKTKINKSLLNETTTTSTSNTVEILEWKYEFTFTHLDIIDIGNKNFENNTFNINRIKYKAHSQLYHYFREFEFFYKIFISFTIILFVVVLISIFNHSFNPNSKSLNNIILSPKDTILNKRNKNLIIYSTVIILSIPIIVSMTFLIRLDFKDALRQDSKYNEMLKTICYDKQFNHFGYCNIDSRINPFHKNNKIDYQILQEYSYNDNNGYTYKWESFSWSESILVIKMTVSFVLVCFVIFLIVATIYFNLIVGLFSLYKIKRNEKKKKVDIELENTNKNNNNDNKGKEQLEFPKGLSKIEIQQSPSTSSLDENCQTTNCNTSFSSMKSMIQSSQNSLPSSSSLNNSDGNSNSSNCGSSNSNNSIYNNNNI